MYRINNSGYPARARRVIQGWALRPTPNSPILFRPWWFRKGQAHVVQRSLQHRKDGRQAGIAIPRRNPNGKSDWRVRLGSRQGRRSDGRTPPWYQEVCEVLFRLFPNCVFAFSRPLTILRGFRWFFLRFAAALAPATNAVIGPQIRSAAGGASSVIRRRAPSLKSENAARIITP